MPAAISHAILAAQVSGNDAFTSLLVHADGTDGSTSFPDSSPLGVTVTPTGTAQIDTAQSVFGGASALFPSGANYITVPNNAGLDFGTGDFTVDFRARFNTVASLTGIVHRGTGADGTAMWTVYVFPVNKLQYGNGAANLITSTSNIAINTWYHIAITRASGTVRMFINGNLEGSASDANSKNSGAVMRAGISHSGVSMNGWIDELRVSKGIARWTANFTPPAQPYG